MHNKLQKSDIYEKLVTLELYAFEISSFMFLVYMIKDESNNLR